MLAKGSNEEEQFIKNNIQIIKSLNTSSIQDTETLEKVVQLLSFKIKESWHRNSKLVSITRYSKAWWNEDYCLSLKKYHLSQSLENWCNFKSSVKKSKCSFFNDKIEEIANKKSSLWKLMNWVKKCKLPAIKAIQYEGCPCIELEDLWNTLHNFFNKRSWPSCSRQ